ncbi:MULTISPECIES: 1-acyl-sn-glycerol-3-phosphate acyltransferase [unclassified Fusibacter]|uniref:lysophospholipid acyltransferase family protein n=1 Tax=unclassified Fusibacter TaxID=2624464 RepID=UPI00101387B2|nr:MULTISPECIES: lysophospholipid acyltransferase family protein [unclassified Fusibacter]MCK8061373.1 1-acyl-sn-glycerol-3-phosphate acyltransferase [Fusibacter sp. A2]NPE23584.1 1-acyl-sn-glycerol-3-phosphate acyltransferase [Fusibacter sp. A1]RXV58993.1 1-acyl-sn-glycerol-3-phosphate acyltransferase [Fusibacter sp. A1]
MKLVIIAIKVAAYMTWMLRDLVVVKRLTKKGLIKERNEIVARVSHDWSKFVVNCTKSTVEVIGEENLPPQGEPLVIVANHQSAFDIPLLCGYLGRPVTFISKIENKKLPFVGSWLEYSNCVFIDRGNPRAAVKTMAEGVEIIKAGYTQGLFPEGTRSEDGSMSDFKPGGFRLAQKSGAKILPVTIIGGNLLMPKGTFKIRKQHIKLIVAPLVEVGELSTRELAVMTHDIVEENLIKYSN